MILTFALGFAAAAYLFHQVLLTSLFIDDALNAIHIGSAVRETRL